MRKLKLKKPVDFYHANHCDTDGFTIVLGEGDVESIADGMENTYRHFKGAHSEEQREFLSGPVYEQLWYAKSLADKVARGEALNGGERQWDVLHSRVNDGGQTSTIQRTHFRHGRKEHSPSRAQTQY